MPVTPDSITITDCQPALGNRTSQPNHSGHLSDELESASYDQIAMIEDSQSDVRTESTAIKFVFLTGCGFFALLGGFAIHLGLSGRRYRAALKRKPTPELIVHKPGKEVILEDPVLFATRALAWGTLYSLLGTGTIGLITVGIWKL